MFAYPGSSNRVLGLVLAVLVAAVPARAAEVDKYLPDDSEMVITINVKQILDSGLVKKYGLEQAKNALQGLNDVNDILKDLGFDPFKDLDTVTIAGPGGNEQDKGLIVVHGRFNLDKFKAKGDDAAKTNSDNLKIHKIGAKIVYEVTVAEAPLPIFVSLVDATTILASFGKDYVVDGLKKAGAEKATLKNKDFTTLLEKMDGKQSLSIAAVGTALTKGDVPGPVKEVVEKLDAVGGGITIDNDIKLEIVASAKTAQDAKAINDKINDGLTQGLAILALLAGQDKKLAPLLDIAKTVKSTAREKTVTLKGEISADLIEKAAGNEKK
jgi:hypothetical protein